MVNVCGRRVKRGVLWTASGPGDNYIGNPHMPKFESESRYYGFRVYIHGLIKI